MRRFISNVHVGYNVVEEVKDLVPLDPIYMLPEVEKYVNAVKSSFPHCNFGVVKDNFNEGATNNIRKVHMYRDQDKYSLGWLGYMDARNAPADYIPAFTICTPNIQNDKYSYDSTESYRLRTTNLKKAISNARAYLKLWSHADVAKFVLQHHTPELRKSWQDDIKSDARAISEAREGVITDPNFVDELQNMLNVGYEFIVPTLRTKVMEYMQLWEDKNRITGVNVLCIHPYLLPDNETQMFDVVQINDFDNEWSWKVTVLDDSMVTYTEDTLPEHIIRKISMITIAEEGQFVEGVGLWGRGMYYVTV
jgi:hypothetical protein